jgi:hypothetical protein
MTRHDVGFFVVGVRVVGFVVGVGADVVGNLLGLVDGLLVAGLTVGVDVMGNVLGLADGLAVVGLSVEVDVGY